MGHGDIITFYEQKIKLGFILKEKKVKSDNNKTQKYAKRKQKLKNFEFKTPKKWIKIYNH